MSAGPALLFESPAGFHGSAYGLGSMMDSTMQGGASSSNSNINNNNGSSSSAFSDEDLIASLAGFAVEGQTERDLATIKSMLLQQHSFGHPGSQHQQQFTHNSYSSSNGASSHWPMASPAAASAAWSSFQWNPASGQPPPNTPTLSKSMELYSKSAQQQHQASSNEYFGGGGGYFSNRRRDVSLERPAFLSNSSRTSSRHARSSSITSSVNADGSSLSTGFDMDMEEEITPTSEAGPSTNPSCTGSSGYHQRSQYTPAFHQQNNEGNHAGNSNNGMEDIQEDSMRESMEDSTSTSTARRRQHLHAASNNNAQCTSSSIFDSRTAGTSSGIAEEESPPLSLANEVQQKQWRSNTSTPVSSNRLSNGFNRPHSANGFTSPSSPPQTRSRSRQQQQAAAAAAALKFTSP